MKKMHLCCEVKTSRCRPIPATRVTNLVQGNQFLPIFEKPGKRICFAHIPKAAGTSVYLLFARNGWMLKNLHLRPNSGIGKILREEFNIHQLSIEGELLGVKTSIQHVEAKIWERWGPFDASFAISRNPADRYMSALRFRYELAPKRPESFEEFREAVLKKLKNNYARKPWIFDGHFRPQHIYLGQDTEVFQLEEDWQEKVCKRFDLSGKDKIVSNESAPHETKLNEAERAWVFDIYAEDFVKLGYSATA